MKLREDAVLFLDVDGTISPLGDDIADAWGDQVAIPDKAFGRVLTSPTLLRALGDLGVPIVWVTDWQNASPTFTPAMFGRQQPFEFLPDHDRHATAWWKAAAVRSWLATHPHVRHVLWADDHLRRKDQRIGTRATLARTELLEQGRTAHLVEPTATIGLTPAHLSSMGRHVRTLPPAP